ncbi:MAG: heavy metal translocating P-type ATPase [Candidatus Dormibacteria bacterium]
MSSQAPARADLSPESGTLENGASEYRQLQLAIRGMSCGACAAKIEKSLNQLNHVRAQVNYASERATVSVFGEVPVAALIQRVESAGYGAELVEGRSTLASDALEDDRRVRYLGKRLLVAALLFMPLGEWSTAFSLLPWLRFPGWQFLFIAMGAPVVAWAAWPFHRAALRAARHGTSTMDTLVSMGIASATGWSLYAMFFRDFSEPGRSGLYVLLHQGGGALYLDVAAGVTTFLLAGRYFEARARRRAGNALRALASVAAKEVAILSPDGSERRAAVGELRVGDRFVVRPGETIATDGSVELGHSLVDCSSMTGEATPVTVTEGDRVLGGTVLTTGRIVVTALRLGSDTQLAHMMDLVEQAQIQKASVQRVADRISQYFVPTVILGASVTLLGWLWLSGSVEAAVSSGLAVLIIACPCALGLATPAALRVASGRGAQLGIFFKGHQGLETSRNVDVVVLDKTGTVTEGRMAVTELVTVGATSEADLLFGLGALEQASEHAVAAAIASRARAQFPLLPQPTEFDNLPGLGVTGMVESHAYLAGRERLLADSGVAIPPALQATCRRWEVHSRTVVMVARDGSAIGAVAVADAVKPSAAPAVAELRALGLRCLLVTGDNLATARAVAAEVGIEEVVAGVLPTEKVDIVRQLQRQGHAVALVGDGVNDGPALAQADLGLAVGSGTDVAINAADLILVRDELGVVPDALRLARRTVATIRGNLIWAFGYNVVAIPLAAAGRLDPLVAGGAMAASSAFVVWNSSRLRHFRSQRRTAAEAESGLAPVAAGQPGFAD